MIVVRALVVSGIALGLLPAGAHASAGVDDDAPELIEVTDAPGPRPRVPALAGRFESRAALDLDFDDSGETVFEMMNRLELALSFEANERLKFVLNARFTHFLAVDRRFDAAKGDSVIDADTSRFVADLRDSYLLWRSPAGLDVSIGSQTFHWGRTILARPLSVLNAYDFREGPIGVADDLSISAFAVALARSFGPLRLTGVWLPFFVAHRARLDAGDFALLSSAGLASGRASQIGAAIRSAPEPEADGLTGADVGLRLETVAAGFDIGLAWVYQRDKTPFVDAGSARYRRRHVIGADVAWTVGVVGIAIDFAYHGRRALYDRGLDRALWRPAVHWAVEVNTTPTPWLAATASVSHHGVIGGRRGEDYYLVDGDEVRIAGLVSLLLAFDGDARLDIEVDYGAARGDLLLAPTLGWRVSGSVRLDAGMALFVAGRTPMSLGGLYDAHDYAYLRSTLTL